MRRLRLNRAGMELTPIKNALPHFLKKRAEELATRRLAFPKGYSSKIFIF